MFGRPQAVCGVDFSGAAAAGRAAWVAEGEVADGCLFIDHCIPIAELPNSGPQRDQCLPALCAYIAKSRACAVGLDFPFSVPRALIRDRTWEEYIRRFPERFTSPDAFRTHCRQATEGKELMRRTDLEARTPFASYNLRIYRQTFFGIRDILHPLVTGRHVCVLPMQPLQPDRAWLMEVCPASSLKRLDLYTAYKGRGTDKQDTRSRILNALEGSGALHLAPECRDTIEKDTGGDALDSVIAALATFAALKTEPAFPVDPETDYAVEGYVYC